MIDKRKRKWRIIVICMLCVLGTALLSLGGISALLATQAGSQWVLAKATERVNQLENTQLIIGASDGTLLRGLTLQKVSFSNPAVAMNMATTKVRWNPYSLLSSNFYISELQIKDAQVTLTTTAEAEATVELAETELLNFNPLPIGIEIGKLTLQGLRVEKAEQVYQLEQLLLNARLEKSNLSLEEIELQAGVLSLSGDIGVVLADFLPLQANLNWRYDEQIAAQIERLAGEIIIGGDIATLEIESHLQAPVAMDSFGQIQTGLAGGELALNMTHSAHNLVLPFEQAGGVIFDEFSLSTVGSPAALNLTLETNTTGNEVVPSAQLTMNALYQESSLQVESYRLVTQSGGLFGAGQLHWENQFNGSVNYELSEQSPLTYFKTVLPFDIKNLASAGNIEFEFIDQAPHGELTLDYFSGQLGDYPLTASGNINLAGESLQFRQMQIATVDNQLRFDGELSDELNFSWELEAPVLQQLLEGLNGSVVAAGELSGEVSNPQFKGRLQGTEIHYQDFAVSHLELDGALRDGELTSRLELGQASYTSESLQEQVTSLIINLSGTQAQHEISAQGETSYGSLTLSIDGGFSDLSALNWQGKLRQANLDFGAAIGVWQATSEAEIEVQNSTVTIRDSCWMQADTSLCIDLLPQANRSMQLVMALQDYPLGVFNSPQDIDSESLLSRFNIPNLPSNLSLSGLASADFNMLLDPLKSPQIDFSLGTSDAELLVKMVLDEEELALNQPLSEQAYQLTNISFVGQLQTGEWNLGGDLAFSGQNIDEPSIELKGLIESHLTIGAEQTLSGTIAASLEDLSWVSVLVPELSNVHGKLAAEVTLGGSIQVPEVIGSLQVEEGELSVEQLGISLTQVSGSVSSINAERIQVIANATSGEGRLELNGAIENLFSAERQLQAQLNGSDFQLANIPDFTLTVSPDVSVAASDEVIELNGVLNIPLLDLRLIQLPELAVDVSRDAVIVSYPVDQPQLARTVSSEQSTLFDIPVVADFDIVLGDEVSISGFGLSARVDGDLSIQQKKNGSNLTYGELTILEGSYETYGQLLEIRQGKLLFFGAYDNPALDIRATRKVDDVTVGVLMNGTLKNINSQLFSSPELPNNEIVAILVTGKPFSQIGQQDSTAMLGAIASLGLDRSQGLTNQVRDKLGLDTLSINNTSNINNSILSVGKYLSPELFVRYGVGLFDKQSKLEVDYTITERIKLQAETGEYQSVDITYKVEK